MNFGASLTGLGGMAAGGLIGSLFPGPGTAIGMMLGGTLGGFVGNALFPIKLDKDHPPPPKPRENRQQVSTFGAPIPVVYGSGRLAGNIIWMDRIETTWLQSKHRQDGVRYYEHTLLYTTSFAVAFCEGPVESISRIWINNEIFVDYRNPTGEYFPSGSEELAIGNFETSVALSEIYYRIHLGSQDQEADPTISAAIGATDNPAYRGVCYIVFMNFPIGEFNGLPKVEIEIGPYEIGNFITYDNTFKELFLHSKLSSTIIETYDFSAHTALQLQATNALTPVGDLIKYNFTTRVLYVFDGVTPTIKNTIDVSASVPYAMNGLGVNPWNGRIIVAANNGGSTTDNRTIHYIFEPDGTFVSSWQDDSIYGGAPYYAFTPEEQMLVQYRASGYSSFGWQSGDALVLYATYLGTAVWRKWGPMDSASPTSMTSPGILFGSRPVFDYLYLAPNDAFYYRFELSELTDSGSPRIRAVMPASAKIMTDIRNPRGHSNGPQLTNGFEIV
jgi:hypothetical protein